METIRITFDPISGQSVVWSSRHVKLTIRETHRKFFLQVAEQGFKYV